MRTLIFIKYYFFLLLIIISVPVFSECSGNLKMSIIPNHIYGDGRFTDPTLVLFNFSGFSGCEGKYVRIKTPFLEGDSCENGTLLLQCGNETCSYYDYPPNKPGEYKYYACMDMNGDNDYNDEGERAEATLIVDSCMFDEMIFELSPSEVYPLDNVNANIYLVKWINWGKYRTPSTPNCTGQKAYIKDYKGCDEGSTIAECPFDKNQCFTNFSAPSQAGEYLYYACFKGSSRSKILKVKEYPTPTPSCEGSVNLSLSPNPSKILDNITANISGLSNCEGKTAYVKDYMGCTSGETIAKCTLDSSSCVTNFTAPSQEGEYGYYACIDKNDDQDFNDSGEQSNKEVLNVTQPAKYCKDVSPGIFLPTKRVISGSNLTVSVYFRCLDWNVSVKDLELLLKIDDYEWRECFVNNKKILSYFGWDGSCDEKKDGRCGKDGVWVCDSTFTCKHRDYDIWISSNFSDYFFNLSFLCKLPYLSSGYHTLSVDVKIYHSETYLKEGKVAFYIEKRWKEKIIEILYRPISFVGNFVKIFIKIFNFSSNNV